MSVATPHLPYTYADYCTLPEDTARRYERLQGELIRVPAPTLRHPRVSRNLEYIFHHHVHTRGTGEVFYSPANHAGLCVHCSGCCVRFNYCVAVSGSDDSAGRGVGWDMSVGATVGIFDER